VANRDPQSLGHSVLAFCPDDSRRIMVGQARSTTGPRTTKIVLSRRHRFFLSAAFHLLAFGFEAGFPAFLSTLDAGDRISAGRVGEVDRLKNRMANLFGSVSDCLLATGIYPQSASSAAAETPPACRPELPPVELA